MKGFLQASSRSHYGLRVMARLAEAQGQVQSLKTIASRERLSVGYLEEIARLLKRSHLVESVRGAHGGYRLTKPAGHISVADVLAALEGPVQTMVCIGDDAARFHCPLEAQCASRLVWQKANDRLNATFSSITLADLCQPVVGHR